MQIIYTNIVQMYKLYLFIDRFWSGEEKKTCSLPCNVGGNLALYACRILSGCQFGQLGLEPVPG